MAHSPYCYYESMDDIVNLSDALDVNSYGGKAAALAKLLKHDFKVPKGFVINGSVGDELSDSALVSIKDYHTKLGAPYVAVRSSAVSEDGENTSWAGQLETYLNVTSQELVEKIKQCRRSARSARAKAYGAKNSAVPGETAVLVQEMIQPSVSGVAFSVHPVTQDSSVMVIESVVGLGEALVSGSVIPDTYFTSKTNHTVQEFRAGKQSKKLSLHSDGQTVWSQITINEQPNLTPVEITELTVLVSRLEECFGHPVDVEWAQADGLFYVLQCRPITTLG